MQVSPENKKNRAVKTTILKTGKVTKDRMKSEWGTDMSVGKETKAIALTKNSKRTSC